jgi:hypothetical protein
MVVPQSVDRGRDSLVQDLAPFGQNRVVSDIVREGVLEGVLDITAG